MQQSTCIAAAIKLARKWAVLERRYVLDARRPVSPAVEPSTRVLPLQSSVMRSSGSRAVPLTITGELRMIIDWTVRCDWLQVTSCNIMLMRAARLVQVLQDVLQVLS